MIYIVDIIDIFVPTLLFSENCMVSSISVIMGLL